MGLPLEMDPNKKGYAIYENIEYQDYWKGQQKIKLDELEHALVTRLLPAHGQRILDIGCGYARLAPCYMDRFEQVVLLDGSLSLLRQAQEHTQNHAVYVAADAMKLPFMPAAFDAVLLIRVLHHLSDVDASFAEFNRVQQDNSLFLFTYNNKLSPMIIWKWLTGRVKFCPFDTAPSVANIHLLAHHPQFIRRSLRKANFKYHTELGAGVMDKLANYTGRFWRLVPMGLFLAPFFGRTHLAPWMFCSAHKNPTAGSPPASAVSSALFACPQCHSALDEADQSLQCTRCQRAYPIVDGIYDFRL